MRYWNQRTMTQRYKPFFLSLVGEGNVTEEVGEQNTERGSTRFLLGPALGLPSIPNPFLAREGNSVPVIHLLHSGELCWLVPLNNSCRPIQMKSAETFL